MANRDAYVYCFVPQCKSTSISTPEKLFFAVPVGQKRKKWCTAARRDVPSQTSNLHCCEDHFDLECDAAEWMRYRLLRDAGSKTFRLKLKDDVLPHKFDCQKDRKRAHSTSGRSTIKKRQRLTMVTEALQNSSQTEQSNKPSLESTSETGPSELNEPLDISCHAFGKEPSNVAQPQDFSEGNVPVCTCCKQNPSKYKDAQTQTDPPPTTADKEILVRMKPERRSIRTQTTQPTYKSTLTSPFKIRTQKKERTVSSSSSDLSDAISVCNQLVTDVSFQEESGDLSSNSTSSEPIMRAYHEETLRTLNLKQMEDHPLIFFGLHKCNMNLIYLFEKFSGCRKEDIFLTLRKIRRNETFEFLALMFSRNKTTISRSFKQTLPILAKYLKDFVYWPPKHITQSRVPLAFRPRYSRVQSIVDCFEVEIEKLSNPVNQSLTWSDYKKCNTCKFLVSCSPDGFINFISKGYGGRATDVHIVEDSEYLEHLAPGTWVMADRGFKNLERVLVERQCIFIRPPSVSQGVEMSKAEVQQTKVIASLRIHVERVINRIRDFAFLGPHACFHHDLLGAVDYVAVIVCALCNLQTPIVHDYD